MKRNYLILFIVSSLSGYAQQDAGYDHLLKAVNEIRLEDSLHIGTNPSDMTLLDSNTVKKWFAPLLGFSKNNRLKNRAYYLAGKITGNEKFDLLVLVEDKKKADSNSVQVVHLVSTRKDGHYIASLEAAISGVKKKSSFNTSSWLYKNNKIVLDSRILVNDKSFDEMTSYRINGGGRFILSEKWE